MIRKEFCSHPQFLWITLWENRPYRRQGLDSPCSALECSNLMHDRKASMDQGLAPTSRALRGGRDPPRWSGYRFMNFGDKSTPERSLTGRIAHRLGSRGARPAYTPMGRRECACTVSTSAATCSGGVNWLMPWPRLKM